MGQNQPGEPAGQPGRCSGATFLTPFEGPIYAGFRAIFGLMFVQHGLQKIFGLFGGIPADAPEFVRWGAGSIELVGGALVALGFATRWAAFLCSGTMAVAYFMAHASKGFFPAQNGGELAVLYCWAFFLMAAHGSGSFSLDQALGRSR
jgi:putative oxidoreductase